MYGYVHHCPVPDLSGPELILRGKSLLDDSFVVESGQAPPTVRGMTQFVRLVLVDNEYLYL